MKQTVKRLLAGATILLAGLIVAGCGNKKAANSTTTVKIGIMSSDEDIWKPIVKKLKKQDINLELKEFSDYNTPNKALTDHQIDLNSFQHYNFLDSWNKAHKTNIVAIGETYIAPLDLYSTKIKSLKEIKKGDEITIPNDATNEGRALNVLEEAGLITLKKNVTLPTVKDIVKNPKDLKVTELENDQTARSLSDATAAIVTNDISANAGLKLSQAIYRETVNHRSKQWINVIAANKKDKNNKVYKKVVKAYRTAATAKAIAKVYKGTAEPIWTK
ncbi:MetQ/NlpA family ABC transporter substrate-binding protein [Lapidilactobacillus bayanensis]|uniref:MetQ/NlpA family ABC transporter substrate-binding protein n=1 Tax=Lapidilactobacillus bayanensis TaxID=2485998 RepID=UPI000F791F92|nr:MetQ/NlpA family ABC transporter substrate-binding protein [Lapidilactobacillus bayanensis]